MRWDSKVRADLILRAVVVALVLAPLPASIEAIRTHPAGEQLDWAVYPGYFGIAAAAVGVPAGVFGRWIFCALAVAATTVAAATYSGDFGLGVVVAVIDALLCGLCVGMARVTSERKSSGPALAKQERRLMFAGLRWTLGLIISAVCAFVGVAMAMIAFPGIWQTGLFLGLVGFAGLLGTVLALRRQRGGKTEALTAAEDSTPTSLEGVAAGIAFAAGLGVIVAERALDRVSTFPGEALIPVVAVAFLVVMLNPSRAVVLLLAIVGVAAALAPRFWMRSAGPPFSWPGLIIVSLIFTIFGWRLWDRRRRSIAVGLVSGLLVGMIASFLLVFTAD